MILSPKCVCVCMYIDGHIFVSAMRLDTCTCTSCTYSSTCTILSELTIISYLKAYQIMAIYSVCIWQLRLYIHHTGACSYEDRMCHMCSQCLPIKHVHTIAVHTVHACACVTVKTSTFKTILFLLLSFNMDKHFVHV